VRVAKGAIHDQGYQRYTGERRPQARRFVVVARNVVATAWKQKLAVKIPVFGTLLAVIVAGGIMVALTNIGKQFPGAGGALRPAGDWVMNGSLRFFEISGFLLTVAVGAGAIADDMSAGAFQFYFSRPLRSVDYVRGKLLGLFAVVGVATLAGPFVLALVRLAVAMDQPELGRVALIVPKMLLVGTAFTLAMVMPAAALGALLGKKTPARVAFAILWTVYSFFVFGIADLVEEPRLRLLSLNSCVDAIAAFLLDGRGQHRLPPPLEAAGVILAVSLACYAYIRWRVRSAESAGLGAV
jgi:uncharacterized membrane protein